MSIYNCPECEAELGLHDWYHSCKGRNRGDDCNCLRREEHNYMTPKYEEAST